MWRFHPILGLSKRSLSIHQTKLSSYPFQTPVYRTSPLLLSRLKIYSVRQIHGTDQQSEVDFGTMLEHSSKRGMQITWIGFVANIGLTVSKGAAGWMMNSAALLADAAHSFSDLLGDLVTLYTFKMSRKAPDSIYPYGYGKFETFGSLSVSALLIAGGVGIGLHSFDLLLATLPQLGAQHLTDAATATVTSSAENSSMISPLSSEPLDPNAAWFALGSVLIKEWLYRATLKVGLSERSDVLVANAWHHRSDAYSSLVALVAIGGSFAGLPIFDPLGGIIVSSMILKSGTDIMTKSTKELMDKSIEESELDEIRDIISTVKIKEIDLLDFHSIRGRKFGPFHHLDLVLRVNPNLSLARAHDLEQRVRVAIKKQCSYVQEVIIHIDTENQPRHF